jgi:hypothetical protein
MQRQGLTEEAARTAAQGGDGQYIKLARAPAHAGRC